MTPQLKNRLLLAAQLTLTAFLAISFAASFLVAEEQYGFNGIWQRNEDESDDPREKMREAMEAMRSQGGMDGGGRSGRGGRSGGGMMPGGGGGGMQPGGGGGRGGRGGEGRGGGPQGGMAGLMAMTARIETTLQDNEFHVVPLSDEAEGKVQIFYLDGKKHKREASNGAKIETKTEMKGNRIIVEQKNDRREFTTTYELAPDATRMVVTTHFEGGRLPEPIIIRAVYDLTSETE